MKKNICILVFLLVISTAVADDYSELKTLIREGDSAIMNSIENNNADCVAKVDLRYDQFVNGIEVRFKRALFIERVALIIGLGFSILLFSILKKLLDIWVNRIISKKFLLKMQNIENMINETYALIKKGDVENAKKKYKQIRKIYVKISREGKIYIYKKVLDLQKMVMQYA